MNLKKDMIADIVRQMQQMPPEDRAPFVEAWLHNLATFREACIEMGMPKKQLKHLDKTAAEISAIHARFAS